jgi:hypothetical protein
MAEYKDREHYIPLRRSDLVKLLCQDRGMDAEAAGQFRQLCDLLSATFHFEYHKLLEELKNEYAPFDPDEITKPITAISVAERQRKLENLFKRFDWLMERANFKRIEHKAIDQAAKAASDWGLNMQVDWSVFERMELYARGDSMGTRYRRRWTKFFRLESTQLALYQRLVLIVKLRQSKRLPYGIDTEDVFIKIFKDIPKIDLEMLLPGARMRMPGTARLKLGSSFLSGLGLIAYNIGHQLLTLAAMPIGFFYGPLLAVFGYGYRQWYGYQSTKTAHHLRLTQSLYYQNLGNNLGVLSHLLDEAEEQESREAMLAYYYLWRHASDSGWKAADLDDYVEMDLERLANIKVDFEIDDALAKLERLNLVTKIGDRYAAVPIDKALESLDYTWDNYFKYNKEATV